MIGYRLLLPAEEEMTEAAIYYDAASAGLGGDFLDDIQFAIDSVRRQPGIGANIGYGFSPVVAVSHQRR